MTSAQPSLGAEDVNAYIRDESGNLISSTNNRLDVDVTGQTLTCNAGTGWSGTGLALDSSVDGIEALLTSIEADTGNIASNTADNATETTLATLLTEATFISEDFAQESGGNLDTISTNTGTIAGDSTSLDGKITTEDADTGAGTDNKQSVILCLAESGGCTVVGSANPVPISDNGTSITVDGTITADAGTGWSGTGLALESGGNLADAANSLNDIELVIEGTGTSAQEVQGTHTEGSAATGDPFLIAGKDISSNVRVPTMLSAGSFRLFGAIPADASAHLLDISSDGELYALGFSTDGTKANSGYARIDSSDRIEVASRRTTSSALTNVNTTYDTANETQTSAADTTCATYSKMNFSYTLESNGTPTTIQLIPQVSNDSGSTWGKIDSGPFLIYKHEDTEVATADSFSSATWPVTAGQYRMRVDTIGTDNAGNEFVVSNLKFNCISN